MSERPYFPPLYGGVECQKCEISANCDCYGKYQRNRRDFTYTSGRCPRLADSRGFVADKERELYAATFPLIHAERGEGDTLDLTLTIPGEKRSRKVYHTKSGYWYYKTKDADGFAIKKVLNIEGNNNEDDILSHMERAYAEYYLFRCEITDYFV